MPLTLPCRLLWLTLVAYALCLFAGTLWPFNFTADPQLLARRSPAILWNPVQRCPKCGGWELENKAVNLAMFVPFGIALRFLVPAGPGAWRACAVATLIGFLASLTMESTQFFLPGRTPSTSDLILNTLGTLLGALMISWFLHRRRHSSENDGHALA